MTPQKTLELGGNFRAYPFAELIVEIAQSRLSGSLRASFRDKRTVIYFKEGTVVHGVSNARSLRLFSILLSQGTIDKDLLARHPNFANDHEFAAELEACGAFSKQQLDEIISAQIEAVMIDALAWTEGEWTFSPLTKLRDDLSYPINISRVMTDYARSVPLQVVDQRFKSVHEAFSVKPDQDPGASLLTHEYYVLSRFGTSPLTIEQLRPLCSLPEGGMLQALYVLWLGGFLVRHDWNSAFSAAKINEIRKAKLSLIKEASRLESAVPAKVQDTEPVTKTVAEPAAEDRLRPSDLQLNLEQYLEQVENAQTHYDLLGIDAKAPTSELKARYFAMAKLFHPDRFHREPTESLRRIQVAFTRLAQAYEILKNPDSRSSYDFKIRKELEARAKRQAAGQDEPESPADRAAELGLESFELGLSRLADEDFESAAAFLARAVHYNPQNALYRAYFGQALSANDKQRHKAEAEMQAAVRLDPRNEKIRIMLVQFFIDMKMFKRAEGELRRFLEVAPNNTEAQSLLNSLTNQQ